MLNKKHIEHGLLLSHELYWLERVAYYKIFYQPDNLQNEQQKFKDCFVV